MTPSVLAGAPVDGGSITEIGNTKRGEGGGGGIMSCLGLLLLQSFCAIQAMTPQGVRNMDLLLRRQTMDYRFKIRSFQQGLAARRDCRE